MKLEKKNFEQTQKIIKENQIAAAQKLQQELAAAASAAAAAAANASSNKLSIIGNKRVASNQLDQGTDSKKQRTELDIFIGKKLQKIDDWNASSSDETSKMANLPK